MVTFTEEAIRRLPAPIVEKLQGIVTRVRRVLWLKGLWLTVAGTVTALLLVMAIDATFDIESKTVRAALSAAGLAFAAYTAWRHLVVPLRRTISLAAVARYVEVRHPELQERISTAVEILASDDPASLRGSEELLQEVVKSAVSDVQSVSPEAEFSAAPLLWPKRAAMATLALLMLLLVIWPFNTGMLIVRALAPFADVGNASSLDLRVLSGDLVVAEGEPITLLVATKGKTPKRVEAHIKKPDRDPVSERLLNEVSTQIAEDESAYALHIPEARESFTYTVTAGRARSRQFAVTVLHRPEVDRLGVTYTYPAYTGLPPKTDPDSPGDIVAITGTKAEVTAHFTHKVASASIQFDQTENTAGPPVAVTETPDGFTGKWTFDLATGTNFRWKLFSKGEKDLDGKVKEGLVRAADDLPPAIVIDSPVDRELTLRPNEVLPIVYTAADDFGFSAVDIRVGLESRGETLVTCPLPEKDPTVAQTWHGTATLDLSKLPLAGLNTIKVRVRVSDTLPVDMQGPQQTASEEIVIRLNWGAQSFREQTVAKQEQQIRKELDRIKNDVYQEKSKAEEKMWQLRNKEELKAEQLQQLDKLTQNTAQTAQQLQELADKMEKSAFAERAKALEQAAQEMIKPATEQLQQIPQTDNPQDRMQAAENARDQLDRAAKTLEKAMENMWQDKQQADQASQLATLAQQQQQLADQAKNGVEEPKAAPNAQASNQNQDAKSPEQQAQARKDALNKWQEQQQQTASAANNLANQLQAQQPEAKKSELDALSQQAQSLATQAEKLAQKQDALEAQAAQAPDNSPQQAQAAQQQADVASEAAQLSEAIKQFQQQSGERLGQNGIASNNALQASKDLKDASESGREAAQELAQAATQATETGQAPPKPDGAQTNQPATPPNGAQTASTDPLSPAEADAAAAAEAAAKAAEKANATAQAQESGAPQGEQPAAAAQNAAADGAPTATGENAQSPAATQPPAGSEALAQTNQSLDAAAAALKEAAASLAAEGQAMATEAKALGDAAQQTQAAQQAGQQAQQAGQQAGQQASEQASKDGKSGQQAQLAGQQAANQAAAQNMAQNAAQPAQQAANNLAVAAAQAAQAFGIPQQSLNQQNMGQHGTPSPGQQGQQGQNQTAKNGQQNQPGQASDQPQGLQATKGYELPPELAKLGLSADDWARLRGLMQSGADGAEGDRVPAEYRELVKGYFQALAAPAPAPKQ